MAFRVTWISVEQQSLSRASGTKSMGLNSFPGMNSWANLGGPRRRSRGRSELGWGGGEAEPHRTAGGRAAEGRAHSKFFQTCDADRRNLCPL